MLIKHFESNCNIYKTPTENSHTKNPQTKFTRKSTKNLQRIHKKSTENLQNLHGIYNYRITYSQNNQKICSKTHRQLKTHNS